MVRRKRELVSIAVGVAYMQFEDRTFRPCTDRNTDRQELRTLKERKKFFEKQFFVYRHLGDVRHCAEQPLEATM